MNIRKFRMSAGLTQDVLAFKLGVKRQTISMWETGESAPKTEMLPEIAKIFGCTIDDLFADAAG